MNELKKGETVMGVYKIVRKVGSGSFGIVYSAIHTETSKKYAIKTEPNSRRVSLLTYESNLYLYI